MHFLHRICKHFYCWAIPSCSSFCLFIYGDCMCAQVLLGMWSPQDSYGSNFSSPCGLQGSTWVTRLDSKCFHPLNHLSPYNGLFIHLLTFLSYCEFCYCKDGSMKVHMSLQNTDFIFIGAQYARWVAPMVWFGLVLRQDLDAAGLKQSCPGIPIVARTTRMLPVLGGNCILSFLIFWNRSDYYSLV